jgi:dTDP-4-dehydrorhamnose 3,5-epimerase
VTVDIRTDSATYGQWFGITLYEHNKYQLFIPEGFAHGFCVLSQNALFLYKCSAYYDPKDEDGILWCDQRLAIDWPIENPIISGKDGHLPGLTEKLAVTANKLRDLKI